MWNTIISIIKGLMVKLPLLFLEQTLTMNYEYAH